MSPRRAVELQQRVLATAERVLYSTCWEAVAVCAGRDYRCALDGIVGLAPEGVRIDFLGGGQGRRLTKLSAWLRASARGEAQTETPQVGN
jgi:hypothetical protein